MKIRRESVHRNSEGKIVRREVVKREVLTSNLDRFFEPELAEIYERMIAHWSVSGNPFLDREDLEQEVFVTWLEIQRDYGDNPNFIKILNRAIKLHIRTLFRSRIYTPRKNKERVRLAESPHLKSIDLLAELVDTKMIDEITMGTILEEIQEALSMESYRVFCELMVPSEETLHRAQSRFLEKENLRKQGESVGNLRELKITQRDMMRGLKMGCRRFYACLREIQEVVHFVLDKYNGD